VISEKNEGNVLTPTRNSQNAELGLEDEENKEGMWAQDSTTDSKAHQIAWRKKWMFRIQARKTGFGIRG